MNKFVGLCCWLLVLVALPACSDDQQKVQKVLDKISAMATALDGRCAVSLAVSDSLSIGRPELVQSRRAMNLNYGDIVIAYFLLQNGAKMDDIADELKTGEKMPEIADKQHVGWKGLAVAAKQINSKVNDNLIRRFINQNADVRRNIADSYDPRLDAVTADSNVSQKEIANARARYSFLRDHVAVNSNSKMEDSAEAAARDARPDPMPR